MNYNPSEVDQLVDWLNAHVGRRSSSPGKATINSHSQQNRTTLASSPSTDSPSPPSEDNYDNVNGNTSAEENNLIRKTAERCVQILSQTPHLESDSRCNSSNISCAKILIPTEQTSSTPISSHHQGMLGIIFIAIS